MAGTTATVTKLFVVREVQEDESGATVNFEQKAKGRLALGDAYYVAHLRLAQRSQERRQPVGVTFGEGSTIAEIIRGDNDIPTEIWGAEPDDVSVLFLGHDGVFRIKADHPLAAQIRGTLNDASRLKARVWFVAQKPDLTILDVMTCDNTANGQANY